MGTKGKKQDLMERWKAQISHEVRQGLTDQPNDREKTAFFCSGAERIYIAVEQWSPCIVLKTMTPLKPKVTKSKCTWVGQAKKLRCSFGESVRRTLTHTA